MFGFQKMVADSREYNTKLSTAVAMNQIKSFERWTSPPTGFIKINIDAAILEEMEVGLGCVARGVDGKVVAMAARRVKIKEEMGCTGSGASSGIVWGSISMQDGVEFGSFGVRCLECYLQTSEEGKHCLVRGHIRRC